jgi:hypothetical protein
MKLGMELSLALLIAAAPPALAATKDQELPDKEMLRMMEFLKEMEMIKQMDMLRELHQVDGGGQVKTRATQRPAPVQQKGIVK